MNESERTGKAKRMEQALRKYIDGCNEADVEKISSCFTPDARHYFPPGMYDGPWKGGETIGAKWRDAVANMGSYWTIDGMVIDADSNQAATEWTHFKTKQGTVLRGAELLIFDDAGLIQEIRAYYASPQSPDRKALELGGFDYEGRGWALAPPAGARD